MMGSTFVRTIIAQRGIENLTQILVDNGRRVSFKASDYASGKLVLNYPNDCIELKERINDKDYISIINFNEFQGMIFKDPNPGDAIDPCVFDINLSVTTIPFLDDVSDEGASDDMDILGLDRLILQLSGDATVRAVSFYASMDGIEFTLIQGKNMSTGALANNSSGIGTELWKFHTECLTKFRIVVTSITGHLSAVANLE